MLRDSYIHLPFKNLKTKYFISRAYHPNIEMLATTAQYSASSKEYETTVIFEKLRIRI